MVSIENYYKFRKLICELYHNDVNCCGDLCSRLLEIRDKYRCVECVNVNIPGRSVSIDLDEKTSDKKENEIIRLVVERVSEFLSKNRNLINISDEDDAQFTEFLSCANEKCLFCDIWVVANSIRISL